MGCGASTDTSMMRATVADGDAGQNAFKKAVDYILGPLDNVSSCHLRVVPDFETKRARSIYVSHKHT